MSHNTRDPLSPEAFEAVRARIAEMSGEELMAYLDWRPDVMEDMKFPQHLPYPDIHEQVAVNPGAEPKSRASSSTRRKPGHTSNV